jgi:hypothetical protein
LAESADHPRRTASGDEWYGVRRWLRRGDDDVVCRRNAAGFSFRRLA